MKESIIMPPMVKTPEEFLEYRHISAKEINERISEPYMTEGAIDQSVIQEIFKSNEEITSMIEYVLERFSHPKDASKARRKDGSHIATHSLQLFNAAHNYYKLSDENVGKAVLVHDLIEDTQTSYEDIATTLTREVADLAQSMTEEELTEEEKIQLGSESGILSIAKFIFKLRNGGETISKAEILDRMDDISDLAYLTKKLQNPDTKVKAVSSLEDKFAKCSFTINSLIQEENSEELLSLKDQFDKLLALQKTRIEQEYAVAISEERIKEIVSRYQYYFDALNKSHTSETK